MPNYFYRLLGAFNARNIVEPSIIRKTQNKTQNIKTINAIKSLNQRVSRGLILDIIITDEDTKQISFSLRIGRTIKLDILLQVEREFKHMILSIDDTIF